MSGLAKGPHGEHGQSHGGDSDKERRMKGVRLPGCPPIKSKTMIDEDIRQVLNEVRELRQMVGRLLTAQKPPEKERYMSVKEASLYTSLAEQTLRLY